MDLWKIEKIEKSIQVLWHLSNTCWLTGDSKLSTGLKVSVNGCLFLR